jgi:Fe-S-cluster containining protein
MQDRFAALEAIYESFEQETATFRSQAACARGCAYCCTDAGRIDATTLEGLRIRDRIAKLPRPRRLSLKKVLKRDMQKREAGAPSPCPFLMKTKACLIYPIRPFACRRIYSLQRCSGEQPPVLSRQVMAIADNTIAALQHLDANGYSGHLAFILHMLEAPRFLAVYRAGEFRPEEIMAFGKSHRIVINKMAVNPSASPPS